MNLFRTKPLEHFQSGQLKKCLTSLDLTFLGIGAIIGAGVFVLTGIAAATAAGPGIVLSYIVAGLACAFSAFSYAELSAAIGGSGSAYGYAYAGIGELFAWIIGWALILEYSVAVSAVSIGWSGYVNNMLAALGYHIPLLLTINPSEGGLINLPALLIVAALTILLCFGAHKSSRFNNIIVLIKLLAIGVFIAVAAQHVNPDNWHPFLPFGWEGISKGAALIFFAYIGFDAVSTAAEEAINPQRDLPRGIIGSLIICTVIYVIVSGLLTGITHYSLLNVSSPVADALLNLDHRFAAGIISAGAIAGLTTVMLVMFYGLTRIFYAMSRDKLLPPIFSRVSESSRSPIRVIIVSGVVISLISGFVPMSQVAELVNIGTLAAFTIVSIGVIMLRIRKPKMHRPFKVPFYPVSPILGILLCIHLMLNLSEHTWERFFIWMMTGLLIYFSYSYRHSLLRKK